MRSATSARSSCRDSVRFLSRWPISRREHSGALSGSSSASFLLTFSSRRSCYASYRRTIRGTLRGWIRFRGAERRVTAGIFRLHNRDASAACLLFGKQPLGVPVRLNIARECGFTCLRRTGARCADARVTFRLRRPRRGTGCVCVYACVSPSAFVFA